MNKINVSVEKVSPILRFLFTCSCGANYKVIPENKDITELTCTKCGERYRFKTDIKLNEGD